MADNIFNALVTALNGGLGAIIEKEVREIRTALKRTGSVAEGLRSAGLVSKNLTSPGKAGSEADRETYAKVKEILIPRIALGFTETDRRLLACDTKVLSDAEKLGKRYAQQQLGAVLGRYARALKKLENRDAPEREPEPAKTYEAKTIEILSNRLALAQEIVGPAFDIVKFVKLLENAIKILS